jgi:hypothetical protein
MTIDKDVEKNRRRDQSVSMITADKDPEQRN